MERITLLLFRCTSCFALAIISYVIAFANIFVYSVYKWDFRLSHCILLIILMGYSMFNILLYIPGMVSNKWRLNDTGSMPSRMWYYSILILNLLTPIPFLMLAWHFRKVFPIDYPIGMIFLFAVTGLFLVLIDTAIKYCYSPNLLKNDRSFLYALLFHSFCCGVSCGLYSICLPYETSSLCSRLPYPVLLTGIVFFYVLLYSFYMYRIIQFITSTIRFLSSRLLKR